MLTSHFSSHLTLIGNKLLVYKTYKSLNRYISVKQIANILLCLYLGVVHASSSLSLLWWVSSLYLQGKEKWQVWIVWQIWFVKPLPWVCAPAAFPRSATQWNKYALAPVCVSPQHFSHRSSHSWKRVQITLSQKGAGEKLCSKTG